MAVNLSFIGGAGWQFFDNNGVPLAGGKIYTYAAGTTTPLATYTARDGLTANTNPIILDSAGRTPAQIWSTEGVLYKYVLAQANDVILRTYDNIGGSVVASDLAQDLANTTDNAEGDALIGFRQSGSGGFLIGAVARTVNNKLQENVSVKDFGAVGDGATDDTAAIQAALNAGRAVYFPATPNGYRISAKLTIGQPNKVVYGDGRYASYLNLASQNFDIFDVTAVGNVQIRDIGAINFGAATAGFFVNGAVPYDLEVIDCYTNAVHSGVLSGTAGSVVNGAKLLVRGCKFVDIATTTGRGVLIRGGAEIRDVIDCQMGRLGSTVVGNNAAGGVTIEGGIAINLSNLQLTGAGNPVLIQPGADGVAHVTMDRVWCDSSSGNGMFLDGSGGIITDVRADVCWFSSNGLNGIRIRGVARDVKIDGNNQILNNGLAGITVDDSSTVPGLSIRNSSIGGNASTGVILGANITGFAVQNNQIGTGSVFGANANGIALTAGATNGYIITGNDLRGNTGSAYISGATGVIARVEANLGYNPVGTFGITVGASPYTYTAGASPETVFINGGTVNVVTVNSVPVFQQTNCTVRLEPFQSVVVNYSVLPSMVAQVS